MTPAGWAATIAVLLVVMNLASQAIALWRLRRPLQRSALLDELPPVTIVRPVRGVEAFSRETAVSGLELDYPRYSTIFCVADAHDPIIPLMEELIGVYGAEKARLIVGDVPVSANPKLNNCVKGWEAARTEWVILADSNVLMPKDYIQRLLASCGHEYFVISVKNLVQRLDVDWLVVHYQQAWALRQCGQRPKLRR